VSAGRPVSSSSSFSPPLRCDPTHHFPYFFRFFCREGVWFSVEHDCPGAGVLGAYAFGRSSGKYVTWGVFRAQYLFCRHRAAAAKVRGGRAATRITRLFRLGPHRVFTVTPRALMLQRLEMARGSELLRRQKYKKHAYDAVHKAVIQDPNTDMLQRSYF
jgi:hypothetical protein